jgi:hypothetical protein
MLVLGEAEMNDFCPKSSQSNGRKQIYTEKNVVNIILGLH